MPDVPYELKNNNIDTIPFMGSDAANDLVPLPAGTILNVTNANPAELQAVMNGSDLVLNCLAWPVASNGIRVEVDDVGALAPFAYIVTVVEDLTPVSVAPNPGAITHAQQPVPGPLATPPPGP